MINVLFFLYVIPVLIEGENHVQNTDIDASRTHKGIITSPGYPGNYPNDVNYTWTLKTGNPQATIFLEVSDFSIVKYKYTSNCEDYLQIKMTEPRLMLIMERCGELIPFNLEYTGIIFTLTFVSDHMDNARGFNISWTVNIPDTTTRTTTKPTKTTTKITTTKKSTKKSQQQKITTAYTTGTKSMSTKIVGKSSRTTTSSPFTITRKSKSSETLASLFFKSTSKQPMTYTNGSFTDNTEASVASKKVHTTTDELKTMLIVTMPTKKTSTLLSTQPLPIQNSTIAHTHTDELITLLTATEPTKKISTLLSTQPPPTRNSTIENPKPILDQYEILYIVAGISGVELTLVSLGIYIAKHRRANIRHLTTGKPDKEIRPVSRKSMVSVGNVYESIPLEHFSIKDAIPEEIEGVYTEVPENVYDKTFQHRPHVNVNANGYQLISEVKTKTQKNPDF